MDEQLRRALAAAARAFADALAEVGEAAPVAGSAESMYRILRAVAEINDQENRGVQRKEMAKIAISAGVDPRGMAGYYTKASGLLRKNRDGRWITATGRKRLEELGETVGASAA